MKHIVKIFLPFLVLALTPTLVWGQVTWTGVGGDGLWTTATNWSGNAVPTSSDNVILDNTTVTGSYTVTIGLADSAKVRTIQIGYSGNTNTITLYFASSNAGGNATTPRGFVFGDGASGNLDFSIDQGGVFINASNAASGTTYIARANAADSLRVKSGGKFIEVTERSFATPFPAATTVFNQGSTFELNVRGSAAATPSISGRTFGNFIIGADSAGGSRSYGAATGGGAFTVTDTWTVKSGVTLATWTTTGTHTIKNIDFESPMSYGTSTGTLIIGGNITTNALWTTSYSMPVVFNGSSAQTIGGSTPIAFAGMNTINNSNGITINQNDTIKGNLTFNSGKITVGGTYTLFFGSSVTAPGAGVGKFVDGNVARTISATGKLIWPLGQATDYLPDTVFISAVITPGNLATQGIRQDRDAFQEQYMEQRRLSIDIIALLQMEV